MKFKITLLALITVLMISCSNDDDGPDSPLENSTTIRVDDDLFSNAPDDDLWITAATITGNMLNITIDYGGGCGEVFYDLVTDDNYTATDPIQKNIRLAFDDKDNCEASVELQLSFDLTAIQLSSTDSLLINLDGWAEQIEYPY